MGGNRLLSKIAEKAHLISSPVSSDAPTDAHELTTTRVDAVKWQPKAKASATSDSSDDDAGDTSTQFVDAHEQVTFEVTQPESRSNDRAANSATNPIPTVESDDTALRITAGPDYDKTRQKLVQVNGSARSVSNQVKVAVRIRDYGGLPSDAPKSCKCFDSSKDTFAIAWSITPAEDIEARYFCFGVDTGHNPIKKFGISASLVNRAFDIIKHLIDNSLSCDISSNEPWMMGPAVRSSTMKISIGEKHGTGDWSAPDEAGVTEGAVGEGNQARELIGWPSSANKRRKHLSDDSKLASTVLEKGRTYSFEFGNGYIDWKDYALKLPGFSISLKKYIGGKSKVRFFLKNTRTGQIYLVVMVSVLKGEGLQQALAEDQERSAGHRDRDAVIGPP